ncbi:hypothetical protein L7F22_061193 [Adiantum nelumboides]|nr:hypothetical protein [Adiantum nelumboides]
MAEAQPQSAPIFHEKQRLQLCLLHSLNNLYQSEAFTRCELNNIACSLPRELHYSGPFSHLFSSHYNILTGNYDANVLARALQSRGAEMSFCNQQFGANGIDLDDPMLLGFIFNHQTHRFGWWKGRHWAALRKINGTWVDLDSDLPEPITVGNNDAAKQFIGQRLEPGSRLIRVFNIEQCLK